MLPDILLPGISETRQDDQGSFLCGVVVPEQPGPQEHHRGLSSSTILRGPPEQPADPRAGRSGRSRERLVAPSAAGAGGRPSGAEQSPPEGSPERTSLEEAGGRSGRRLRTAFSAEQVSTLESSFQRQQYLGAAERRKLAGRMRLSEVQIKTWFQNRRMKLKRQLQELRTESFCSSPLPYGPQSSVVPLPLTYMSQPPPLFREGAASGGFTLAALPAPSTDLSSACRAQPVGFWAAPCFVRYGDPTAFLLGV
ncbi:homeobox protein vent1-like [Strigops habroptila]|uniref:homeobox protein vent1-like n=1 Tax=Strigops habroptila TaxID=2489341 RepID=UPI0011CEE1A1|nr:homeobox protein vent1-like [Strigops habroptila]